MNELFSRAGSPESVGLSSEALRTLLDALAEKRLTMHGFMVVRNGKVAAEGAWSPFQLSERHRMYSISKSFTSLAVGCLIGEGRLHLDDAVWEFFPDKVPQELDPWLRAATVRDLLMMATPHDDQSYTVQDKDWAWTFFNTPCSHPAGTIFRYDTAGTVILCTIVERLTGMTFLEYLRPRLFDPIGATKNITCVQTPEGTSWGGSGVLCTLEDMARVAYVCMHHGCWGERQLIPREYVDAAIAKQIDNSHFGAEGYGYQIWRIANNGFGFFGMGSQYAFCFPDLDLLFACTADTQSDTAATDGAILQAVQQLRGTVCSEPLPEDPESLRRLRARIEALALPPLAGEIHSDAQAEIGGAWYVLRDNPMGIRRLRLVFTGDEGRMEYEKRGEIKSLDFALGGWKRGEFPELYFNERIGVVGSRRYRCFGCGAWVEPHKLYIRVDVADDYFGGLQIVLAFKGNGIGVFMSKVAEWFLDDYQGFAGGELA